MGRPAPEDKELWPGRMISLRADLGISRKELAQALGVDPTTVHSWEKGKYCPNEEAQEWIYELKAAFQMYGH